MTEGDARPKMTPRELLDFREQSWGSWLSRVSLVAEAHGTIKQKNRQQALEVLGRIYRQAAPRDHRRILRRWPAVHVVTTTGVATDHFASNTFWPHLRDSVGVRAEDQGFQPTWGTAFLENLRVLGLPTFEDSDDAGTRYVGRILMHSGMPTSCLDDYFELVSRRRAGIAGLSPEAFVAWASAQAARGALYAVDKPVARFLQYGGEFAVDVTGRVFDLLDVVSGGGDGADVALPGRFAAAAQELHRRGRVARAARGSSSPTNAAEQPRVVLDPFGFGLVLRLPSVTSVTDRATTWVVDADDTRQRVQARAMLAGLDAAPPTDVPVHRPVRMLSAALADREDLTTTLSVVDEADPLLAFDENGELRSAAVPLPGRPVWFLFPGAPDDLEVTGTRHVLTESPLPPGWAGWCLLLLDLENVKSVSLAGTGSRRTVRGYASARVRIGDPVSGVHTALGRPAHAELPTVVLPDELSAADWEVILLGADGSAVARWRRADGGDPDDLWDQVARPVVGSFTLQVRGPWGRGTSRTFDVVEGLRATFTPGWRRFDTGGLQPAGAVLQAMSGVTLSRDAVELAPTDRDAAVRAGAHGGRLSLVVGPPHMTVAYLATGSSTAPSIRPLQLAQEDVVDDPGTLVLDVGRAAEPRLHYLGHGGLRQVVEPGVGRNGVYQFNLARLTDTLRTYPQGVLALDPDGVLVVGQVRPRRLFSRVLPVDDGLELTDCVDVEGLTAFVYATTAPWLSPEPVPVVAGRAELPTNLRRAGPLVVMVRIEDPWVPLDVPEWPSPGDCVLVGCDGHVVSEDAELTALSAFLADDGPAPAVVTDFSAVWTARGLAGELGIGSRAAEVTAALDRILRARPREALLSVTESRAPGELVPSFIIRSGLAWANLVAAHDDEPPVWTVRNVVPATLLSAADGEWTPEEVEAAVAVCGAEVISLLGGEDPAPSAGLLDAGARLFDESPEKRDAMLRQMGLVPKGLLSNDARVMAVIEYVQDRRADRLGTIVKNAHQLFVEGQRFLEYVRSPVATASVRARTPRDTDGGWRVVPAISLTYAFAARLAAHGHSGAATWLKGNHKATWATLAEVAPELVTVDLVLAELLVSSTTTTRTEA